MTSHYDNPLRISYTFAGVDFGYYAPMLYLTITADDPEPEQKEASESVKHDWEWQESIADFASGLESIVVEQKLTEGGSAGSIGLLYHGRCIADGDIEDSEFREMLNEIAEKLNHPPHVCEIGNDNGELIEALEEIVPILESNIGNYNVAHRIEALKRIMGKLKGKY